MGADHPSVESSLRFLSPEELCKQCGNVTEEQNYNIQQTQSKRQISDGRKNERDGFKKDKKRAQIFQKDDVQKVYQASRSKEGDQSSLIPSKEEVMDRNQSFEEKAENKHQVNRYTINTNTESNQSLDLFLLPQNSNRIVKNSQAVQYGKSVQKQGGPGEKTRSLTTHERILTGDSPNKQQSPKLQVPLLAPRNSLGSETGTMKLKFTESCLKNSIMAQQIKRSPRTAAKKSVRFKNTNDPIWDSINPENERGSPLKSRHSEKSQQSSQFPQFLELPRELKSNVRTNLQ